MKKQRGFTILELIIAIGGVASIVLFFGALYVIGHFIAITYTIWVVTALVCIAAALTIWKLR